VQFAFFTSHSFARCHSSIFCHIEKSLLGNATGSLRLHLRGLDMKNVEPGAFGLGRSDPFFEISKRDADYTSGHVKWNVVYRSKHIENNLNPYWDWFELPLEDLCYGKLDWPLKISFYDHNDKRRHKLIGEIFETSVPVLQNSVAVKGNADREKAIPICREDKKDKKYGLICVLKAELRP
jgi:Ca2+-dependent lipid-binding protein